MSGNRVFESIEELAKLFKNAQPLSYKNVCSFDNLVLNFDLHIYKLSKELNLIPKGKQPNSRENKIVFTNTIFSKKVVVDYNIPIDFTNCRFNSDLEMNDLNISSGRILFSGCFFHRVDFYKSIFKVPVEFYLCKFKEVVILSTCTFHDTISITECKFSQNLTILNSTFRNQFAFVRTKFHKGLDLSTSRFLDDFKFRQSELGYFKSNLSENQFKGYNLENAQVYKAFIPIENKRSTYRFLKQSLKKDDNIIDSLNFEYLEKITYLKETWSELTSDINKLNMEKMITTISSPKKLILKLNKINDLIILSLNFISNRYKSSFMTGIIFTFSVGLLFFYLSLLSTDKYTFAFEWYSKWHENIPSYISFLNPIHKPDYLGKDFIKEYVKSNDFYVYDFLGRVFVGYGLYQTAQAFRKYR